MSDDSLGDELTEATTRTTAGNAAGQGHAPNTLLNAFIGGVVGVVLSFLPFSTVLGGGVAGYLEGGDYTAGAKVGAIAGLVAFVPFVLIIGLGLAIVPVTAVPELGVHPALWVSVLLILLLAALYTVGLSMLGGVLGVYVKMEL